MFAWLGAAIEDARTERVMARAAHAAHAPLVNPELRYVWVAQQRTELRMALPRPVASPGWRRLPGLHTCGGFKPPPISSMRSR